MTKGQPFAPAVPLPGAQAGVEHLDHIQLPRQRLGKLTGPPLPQSIGMGKVNDSTLIPDLTAGFLQPAFPSGSRSKGRGRITSTPSAVFTSSPGMTSSGWRLAISSATVREL